jgi:N-acyl homoserine lactone hydrolase
LLPGVNMAHALKVWPLLTGTIRYEKILSTPNRGHGEFIDAPILAYLIETPNERILYDAGCDYRKLSDPALRARYSTQCVRRWNRPACRKDSAFRATWLNLG